MDRLGRSDYQSAVHFEDLRTAGTIHLIVEKGSLVRQVNEKSRRGNTPLKRRFAMSAYRSTRRPEITALRFFLSSVLSLGFQ
jgi:hypothetical protein